MADRNANIIISVRGNADAETRKLAGAFRDLIQKARDAGQSQQIAERQALSHAAALARLAVASGQAAQGEKLLAAALSQVDQKSTAAVRAQTQLITIQQRGAGLVSQFGSSFKSSLLGILGPAALATAAIGLIHAALQGAEEGFKLQASLDASRTSIALLLRGVRDSGAVFAGATKFGQQYKLTQQEITEATLASIRVLRTSKAPIEDVLGVFARLKILAPEKTFSDAARALGELQAGQLLSLEKMFNVPLEEAHKMKIEIDGGADAVQVLSSYLDRSGVSMEAVAAQATGAAGALKDLATSNERLQLALGGEGGGPGLAILKARTFLTDLLSSSLSINAYQAYAAAAAYDGAYNAAIARGLPVDKAKVEAEEAKRQALVRFTDTTATAAAAIAAAVAATEVATQATTQHTNAINDQINAAIQLAQLHQQAIPIQIGYANSMEMSGVQARAAALAAEQKSIADRVGVINTQAHAVAEQALAAQAQTAARAMLNTGARGVAAAAALANSSQDVDKLTFAYYGLLKAQGAAGAATGAAAGAGAGEGAGASAAASAAAAAKARQAQILATGTHAQKLRELTAIYREQVKLFGPDSAQAIDAQTNLIREQQSIAKSHTSELNKQLNLEERIADSKEKQLRSAIDARLGLNDDAKRRILETDELRRAQLTATNSRDPRIRALAQLEAERIPLEQAKRALDIRESFATAGGQLRDGKIIQGARGGALPTLPGLPGGGGALPSLPGLPGMVGGAPNVQVFVTLDSEPIAARVVVRMGAGLDAVIGTGAGRP